MKNTFVLIMLFILPLALVSQNIKSISSSLSISSSSINEVRNLTKEQQKKPIPYLSDTAALNVNITLTMNDSKNIKKIHVKIEDTSNSGSLFIGSLLMETKLSTEGILYKVSKDLHILTINNIVGIKKYTAIIWLELEDGTITAVKKYTNS